MKGIHYVVTVAVTLTFLMTGCSKEQSAKYNYDTSAIYLDENESISEIIVEKFDKDYYNIDELRQSMEQAVDDYNQKAGRTDAVILDKFEYSDGKKCVKVILDYASAADYVDMNKRTFFIGTIPEAENAGFSFGGFRDLQSDEEKFFSAKEMDDNWKVVVYEKDETEDGNSGQELVTDKYTLLYDCAEVTSESVDRPLRATIVE